ncbi:MAG: hypothetical protein ACJAZ3_002037 [Sphingobacteriales bacterium]|jgi:uncharacterized protein (TIGR02757 family)
MQDIKGLLDDMVERYNRLDFIENDPISIPHHYSKKQDIEIMGLFASLLAWGQRKTIINKCKELESFMDNDPHNFILNHKESDLKPFADFKHRTFNGTDALYFMHFLKESYGKHESLEELFLFDPQSETVVHDALISFRTAFTSNEHYPHRTGKHVSSPLKKSACKRLNMYLRWMVRKDEVGVDFGIWNKIKAKDLYCPLDVHVDRSARKLGLLTRKQSDWLAVEELTNALRKFDPIDPIKYDFALFGLSLEDKLEGKSFSK